MKNNQKPCEFCGAAINSNNKHRTSCYECKNKYPFEPSDRGQKPFNRIDKINEDKNLETGKKRRGK